MEVVAPASSNFSPMPVEVGTTSALPRPKNHLHHGEPIITAALDGSADDESASLRSPSPPREKEKKKKKSLRQTHDGLAHRKASKKTKKKKANESDDDHIPSRSPSAPLRAKSRKSSRSPKKSPKGSTSEEDEDHAAVAAAVKRSKLKPKRSHSVGAKEVLANRAKHSKAQRLSPTYHHYAAEDNDNDDNTSDVNDEIDDVVGRTVVAHKKSHDKRSHKHKRPSPVSRRSRPVTPSDSDEETSEDERSSSDEAVTTPQRRKSKRASPLGGSSSGSSRSPEDLGLVSPKGEEIGRMHKEIETLKNLTKLLEEKLEILEHAPDDAAAGTATSSGNSSNASSSKHTSTRQLAHSGSAHSRASDSSDGETSRKKIRPRYATTSPAFHTPKRVEQAEVSRSTADFTKHSRKVFDKKDRSKKVRRVRRHDAVASSSDYSDSSDSDNGNGNGEQRQLRKSISLSELRGLAQQGHSGNEAEVSQIKKDRDREHRVNKKRAQRERARGHREAEAERRASPPAPSHPQVHSPTSPSSQASSSSSSSSSAAKQAAYVSPFGNSPTTKSLEYCCSCLMKTDIPTDGDRKLWKRRVLGLGANGLNLIKPYTEKVERVWAWATIQQWIINDEQNLIKFMIEEEVVTSPKGHGHGHNHGHGHGHGHRHASSSDESDVETSGTDSDEAGAANPPHQHKVVVYTFRVDDANKINDALWKVVKRIQKKRRGLNIAGGGGNGGGGQSKSSRSSAQSSARNSDDEGGGDHVIRGGVDTSADAASGSGSDSSDDDHHHHHHHFKESVQSLFKALTHSLGGHGHGKDHHKEKDNHHKDHHDKITK